MFLSVLTKITSQRILWVFFSSPAHKNDINSISGNTQQTSSPWSCRSCRLKGTVKSGWSSSIRRFTSCMAESTAIHPSACYVPNQLVQEFIFSRHLAYTDAFERITSISSYMMITFCTLWRPNDPRSFAHQRRRSSWFSYQARKMLITFGHLPNVIWATKKDVLKFHDTGGL